MTADSDTVSVLCVDDEPGLAELTSTYLEREEERFHVETATSASDGLARLDATDFDCIVSDYEMPGMGGLDFLEVVREDDPELPFILFTGKGSEAIASEAISSGVTDYLQKESGTGQYTVLANRIRNAVEQAWTRRERQRQLDATETAREGVSILDDGRYIYVNSAYAELYGYEPEELLGNHWSVTYPDDEIPRARDVLTTVEETGYWHGETTGLRADGSTFVEDHVLATTEYDKLVCTVRDVTDRENRLRELEQTRDRMEYVLERIDAGIWEFDLETDTITSSPDPCPVMGAGVDTDLDFLGKIQPEDRSRVEDAMRTAAETGVRSSVEFRTVSGVAADWVETSIEPIEADDGTVSVVTGLAYDITDRKRREQDLSRQNERLDEFASVVSHDVQSPLNVVEGRLELAREEADSEHLAAAAEALDRTQTLLDDLLTLAREGEATGELERVRLAGAVEDSWQHVGTAAATLVTETEQTIRADPRRVQQLLDNLVRNSVEHGSTNGRTESDGVAGHGEVDVVVTVGDLDDGTGFYVEDTGPGVPEADRERVFERGYSTRSGGTGIGLAIVAEAAEAHGWQVRVTEADGGGSRFEVSGVETI